MYPLSSLILWQGWVCGGGGGGGEEGQSKESELF